MNIYRYRNWQKRCNIEIERFLWSQNRWYIQGARYFICYNEITMIIKDFMDILAWQKAQVLVVDLYKNLEDMKDSFLKEQILRAGMGVSSTIAAGFERR